MEVPKTLGKNSSYITSQVKTEIELNLTVTLSGKSSPLVPNLDNKYPIPEQSSIEQIVASINFILLNWLK